MPGVHVVAHEGGVLLEFRIVLFLVIGFALDEHDPVVESVGEDGPVQPVPKQPINLFFFLF